MIFQPNEMQAIAIDKFCYWYNHPKSRMREWFEISGPAGSGKTSVVFSIIQNLGLPMDHVAFVAFVGKAALALRLSGVNGRTVHSLIYRLEMKPKRDSNGNQIIKSGELQYEKVFVKVEELDPKIELIVVDEGGMIAKDMGMDLLSYRIPLLVLGDKHQLPPVFGASIFLNNPDVTLTEIMRQHKDSSIIYLSQLAMHGIDIPYGSYNNGECRVIRKCDLTDEDLTNSDLVICGTNKMRDTINWYMRKNIYKIDHNSLTIGDKLVCRKNYWDVMLNDDISLVNGMVGYVTGVNRNTHNPKSLIEIDFRPDFSKEEQFYKLPVNHRYTFADYETRQGMFTRSKEDDYIFEFGYCLTCHLSQGSQYDNVLIYVENLGSNSLYQRQWLYTAITRAKKGLTLVF